MTSVSSVSASDAASCSEPVRRSRTAGRSASHGQWALGFRHPGNIEAVMAAAAVRISRSSPAAAPPS